MSVGPFQIVIIAMVLLLLFGRGRVSDMMGEFGKGIKSFRHGMGEAEQLPSPAETVVEPRTVDKHN